jgi:hypothetical protein
MIAGVHTDPALQMLRAICDIFEHCTIKHINLSYNGLGNRGLDTCCSVLGQQRNNLEVVRFVDNGLAAESMALLEDWLAGSEHLTTLIFENQMAGSEGAMHFACIVASCPLLTTIKYAQARAGCDGACAILEAIVDNTGLNLVLWITMAPNSFLKMKMMELSSWEEPFFRILH